jgi:hypothetical protein
LARFRQLVYSLNRVGRILEEPRMADKPTMSEAPGGRRRKRAAPTIDLTATEVPPPNVAAPPSEPPPRPPKEPPPAAGPKESQAHSPPPARGKSTGAALAAGLAGAAIAAVAFAALWYVGLLPGRSTGPGDQSAQIAALGSQVRDLQKRPAVAADNQAVDALRQRVSKIENEFAKLPPSDNGAAERLATVDNAMKSLGLALAALNRRSDDIAASAAKALERADAAEKAVTQLHASVQDIAKTASAGISPAAIDALQKRIASLEQSAKAARAVIATTTAVDTPARLALGAAGLRDVVLSGAPFAAELAAVKSLGADEKALAPLTPFAATGVPNDKTLAHELDALIPAMRKAAGAPKPAGGFLERLQANAGKLVRIRPIDAPPDDDVSALLARIEIAAAKADVAGALADLAKLPGSVRAPASSWIEKANARQAALAAARQFALATARGLGRPGGKP